MAKHLKRCLCHQLDHQRNQDLIYVIKKLLNQKGQVKAMQQIISKTRYIINCIRSVQKQRFPTWNTKFLQKNVEKSWLKRWLTRNSSISLHIIRKLITNRDTITPCVACLQTYSIQLLSMFASYPKKHALFDKKQLCIGAQWNQ